MPASPIPFSERTRGADGNGIGDAGIYVHVPDSAVDAVAPFPNAGVAHPDVAEPIPIGIGLAGPWLSRLGGAGIRNQDANVKPANVRPFKAHGADVFNGGIHAKPNAFLAGPNQACKSH